MTQDSSPGFPDRRHIDLSRDPDPGVPNHAAPEGAPLHPLIDLSRDPTPGVPDHALPDDEADGTDGADGADGDDGSGELPLDDPDEFAGR